MDKQKPVEKLIENTQEESGDAEILDNSLELKGSNESGNDSGDEVLGGQNGSQEGETAPISKNQLKKLKRKQRWDDMADERKRKKKERRVVIKARKRVELQAKIAEAVEAGISPAAILRARRKILSGVHVPVSFIIDCDFDEFMNEKEVISLMSQITRSYSENRTAPYKAHLYVSSFRDRLKERSETILSNTHKSWQSIKIIEEDVLNAAKLADERMKGSHGGEVIDVLKAGDDNAPAIRYDTSNLNPISEEEEEEELSANPEGARVIYLTADSPYTIDRLEPNTSYVIGGIVDRNREKGLCYKRAREKGIRTAKLPIGTYMNMQSRQVLATNHVLEIMLKWLQCGDWGSAFMSIIPKRKGGELKDDASAIASSPAGESQDIEDAVDEEDDDEAEGFNQDSPDKEVDAMLPS
jgi:tRNA (guanine9-N1)-methyltransferase